MNNQTPKTEEINMQTPEVVNDEPLTHRCIRCKKTTIHFPKFVDGGDVDLDNLEQQVTLKMACVVCCEPNWIIVTVSEMKEMFPRWVEDTFFWSDPEQEDFSNQEQP